MKIEMTRSYRQRNTGNVVFVYRVKGTDTEMQQYEEIQGEHFVQDEKSGDVLWFTTKCVGNKGTLIITPNGKVVPDMSAFDQAASLAEQFGGNLGQELARSAAQLLLGTTPNAAAPVAPVTPVAETTEKVDETTGEISENASIGDI